MPRFYEQVTYFLADRKTELFKLIDLLGFRPFASKAHRLYPGAASKLVPNYTITVSEKRHPSFGAKSSLPFLG